MKTDSKSWLLTIIFAGSILFFPLANAESLDLRSGDVQIVDSKTLSLHNVAVDNRYYNAEIELQLDGTYRIKSSERTRISRMARYEVEFVSTWSDTTHPYKYPSGSSHFSGLIGATHNSSLRLWETGERATAGIESMAETGSKSTLNDEIESVISEESAENLLSGGGIGSSPGTVSMEFQISQAYPFVTLVSMIAPSPDWFIGVSALNLIMDGQWVEELVVPLYAYDAGTDNGRNYTSSNSDTNPKDVISRLQEKPFLVDGGIPPLGNFTFRRIAMQ